MITFDCGLGPSTNNSIVVWEDCLLGTIALEKSIQEKGIVGLLGPNPSLGVI